MIKSKSSCTCVQCEKLILIGDWKSKINGFIVCGDCRLSSRLHQNDWLTELAKRVNYEYIL